jgi:hypothetical protein
MLIDQAIGRPQAPGRAGEASAMAAELALAVPPGYRRSVRFGAFWTLITSPYMYLYFIVVLTIGLFDLKGIAQTLELAGTSPIVFGAPVLLDGLSHVLFFVTAATLFAVLRPRWPVRASLILVCGAWQMLIGLTKALITLFTFTSLGAAYVAGDAALRTTLVPVAIGAEGLQQALQQMDSFGVAIIWIIMSLLPPGSGLPRAVRWLGWVLAFALLGPDPGFLLVILLAPIWLFLLGLWLKRLASAGEPLNAASV